MSTSPLLRQAIDDWCRPRKFSRKSTSWYLAGEELTLILQLQKSNYGEQYYINIGIWDQAIEHRPLPNVSASHVSGRVSTSPGDKIDLSSLLDLDKSFPAGEREQSLAAVLDVSVAPLIPLLDSATEFGSSQPGRALLARSIVRKEARRLLGGGSATA